MGVGSGAFFYAPGQDGFGDEVWGDGGPVGFEAAGVAEELAPYPVGGAHLDAKALLAIVVPFADVGDAREEEREAEADWPLVETRRAGT